MPLAAKKEERAAAKSWTAWLEQLDQLQEERAGITGLDEARQRLERAQYLIQYLAGKAWNSGAFPADLDNAAMRGGEDAQNVRAVVRGEEGDHGAAATHLLELMSRAARSFDWDSQSEERRTFVAELSSGLRDAAQHLEETRDEVAALEQARSEVDQRLEALEAKAPKASASSLAAMRKERDAAAEERDRIARALGNVTADDSPLALARDAERAATERLEEAQALLAMGEAPDAEVKAAKAEAEKARQALEERQAEHRSQDAGRRGLARKLEQAESRLETLSRAYRQALGRLRHHELATLESELVADLERIATKRLKAMAEIYADLEEAEPDSDYGRARIKIALPYLHHHPDADELRLGLTITAHGREE